MSNEANQNTEEGILKLSSESIVTDTNVIVSTEGDLHIESSTAPASISIETAQEGTLKISTEDMFSVLKVTPTTETSTLTISTESTLTDIDVEAPQDKGTLKLSAENTPATLSVEDPGVIGNLVISAVQVSDVTIEVGDTITLEAGQPATVTNSGTNKHAILDFGIPKGAEGNGIVSVTLISTEGRYKTYRMTFTNGSYFDYIVTDGITGRTDWGAIDGNISDQTDLQNALDAKQDTLESGVSIKTINEESLLGSGNITITPSTYVFEQGVASLVWTVNHNLDKFPSVSVVDSAGNEVTCSIDYVDRNNCILTMNGEFKGKAYFN